MQCIAPTQKRPPKISPSRPAPQPATIAGDPDLSLPFAHLNESIFHLGYQVLEAALADPKRKSCADGMAHAKRYGLTVDRLPTTDQRIIYGAMLASAPQYRLAVVLPYARDLLQQENRWQDDLPAFWRGPMWSDLSLASLSDQWPGSSAVPTLVYNAGEFHNWRGAKYEVVDNAELRAKLYRFLEPAQKWVWRGKEQSLEAFQPSKPNVDNIIDALKAEAFVKGSSPCWIIDKPNLPPPTEIIAAPNCLLHLRPDGNPVIAGQPTPAFFSPFALDYNIVERAPKPVEWWKFLSELWGDDSNSIELLQEWFGYCLTLDTRQQKILLLIGPPRSGKGTLARILTAMIGAANVCGPTLSGLATNFGLWSLRYKQLAIISDARLSGRTDQAVVTERLLAISGEDAITIDIKNKEPVTERLSTRLMVISNELPRLADASGALANRFIVLMLNESFLGKEDTALGDRLMKELPSILLWAIGGWQRLKKRGHFVQPDSSNEAIEEMMDLASPTAAFVRDWCVTGPTAEILAKDLYEGWKLWCTEQGRDQAGTLQVFGRDLRAALPRIGMRQHRSEGEVRRVYHGIGLTPVALATLAHARTTSQGTNGRSYV